MTRGDPQRRAFLKAVENQIGFFTAEAQAGRHVLTVDCEDM